MSSRIADGTSNTINAPELHQDGRDGRLDTPLGKDKLVLRRFRGVEGISELYEYHVDALSYDQNIDFDRLLGKPACVTIKTYLGVKRNFHGLVTEGQWMGTERRYYAYRLVLRPWTYLLGRRSNSRIFAKKTVKDIIEKIFKDGGHSDYEFRVNASDFSEIEYCVQYRETDLAFISRLMEEWGIYTYFEHKSDKHTLILANQRSSHVKIDASKGLPPDGDPKLRDQDVADLYSKFVAPGSKYISPGSFPFIPRSHRAGIDLQHISDWTPARSYRTGKISLNDFDYMKPGADLKTSEVTVEKYGSASQEAYDYPGRYVDPGLGKKFAKFRVEAEEAAGRRKYATGQAISLVPGGFFLLTGHPTDTGQYLVLQATHTFGQQSYDSGDTPQTTEPYQGEYVLMKHEMQYRAPFVTSKPIIYGSQTAIVTDASDQKSGRIDVDDQGRILVQFHWNREKGPKGTVSRRVRVAQMWSGKDWGWQVIPRIGQEVVVNFLEGDPDQPLVVGTVYNADYKYPYPLPDNWTISGVKTQCEEGQPGYNELIFEDKKAKENIRIHAQRFHEITVREKETRTIGVAQKASEVARETTIENGHDNLLLKHGDQVTLLKKGDQTTKLEMGDQNLKLELGDQNVDVAKNINIKAAMGITIECGQSKITMTPASIKIESVMISVEAQAMTQIKGSAMVTVKGGIVMIN